MSVHIRLHRGAICVSICLLTLLLVGCGNEAEVTPNEAAVAAATRVEVVAPTEAATATAVPVTATAPPTLPPPPTFTSVPTSTPVPATDTPLPPTETEAPTETATVPTNTPLPTATETPIPPTQPPAATQPPAPPTVPANPVLGANILPNGSFEGGWYHTNGVGELQTPNNWTFQWDEGPTGYGDQSWDVWVRPEMRVLSRAFLPPEEHSLFIFDGEQTVKVFKGNGAISYRLFTDMNLEPGTYIFEINIFTDLYVDFRNGQKVWANDPFAGEIRFIAPGGGTGWFGPAYGRKNSFTHSFTISEAQSARIGVGIRGRYAIANNGWFLDDWSLQKVEN